MNLLRSIAAWIFTSVYWTVVVFFMMLMRRRLSDDVVSKVIHFWGKFVLKILAIEIEKVNTNPLLEKAPRVVVCNHQSALDIVWGAAICPPRPLVIGKKEIVYVPFLNLIWWAFHFIRIDRKNTARALRSLEGVSQLLRQDSCSLMIAPEGTRTLDGKIGAFKKGAFYIAIQAQVPIYPIVVTGAYELMRKNSLFAKPGKIKIQFLPPIDTHGKSIKDVGDVMDAVRDQMISVFQAMDRF